MPASAYALQFLGVGAASAASTLGSSSAVLLRDREPLLLIDCAVDTLDKFIATFGKLPPALYLTHAHLDHIGGLENLFFRSWFNQQSPKIKPRIFCHPKLLPWLQERLANYPRVLAEGGGNFWEAFELIPCQRGFWYQGWWFDIFPTRHHRPDTSFGLAFNGSFIYTGDTRPVPETIVQYRRHQEMIFHDCGLVANPSHTGVEDLLREYPPSLFSALRLYHYGTSRDGEKISTRGFQIVHPQEIVPLPAPLLDIDAG